MRKASSALNRCKLKGDQSAREALVLRYSYLVNITAGRVVSNLPPNLDREDLVSAGIVLAQDPHEGARIDPKQGVELVVGLPEKPVPPRVVLDLVTLDARFKAVRLAGQPLSARAQQLGLRDRHALAEFAGAEDAKVREALGLPALRDAQIVKRILRDILTKTE